MREQYLRLISGRSRGAVSNVARAILATLSLPYLCIICIRNLYYDVFSRRRQRVPRPVVSVGNITVGGAGKTPIAAKIATLLEAKGRRVGLLLRGYKGRTIQFDDENRERAAGELRIRSDEAMVLKRRCPRGVVVVNADRVAGARQAISKGADSLILDDGFQHRRLARDLDIVLVDATAPFGYGHMLPRGLLREPSGSLRRADLIVMTRSDQIDETKRAWLLRTLKRASADKPVIQARHHIVGFTDIKGRRAPVDDPIVMQAILFAGIANFESFRASVVDLGVSVVAAYEYPDHHDYTMEEIAALSDIAGTLEANVILTTEKDAVKLVGRWPEEGCGLLVLDLAIEFDGDGDTILSDAIERMLEHYKAGMTYSAGTDQSRNTEGVDRRSILNLNPGGAEDFSPRRKPWEKETM